MKEDERSWFARWEEQLPSPEELTPISQTLITPDLAMAFDIPAHHHPKPGVLFAGAHSSSPPQVPTSQLHAQPVPPPEFEASEVAGGGAGSDEQARTLKRPRLVWTPQLHKRFVDAVAHLGIKNAVPKTIMQMMSVDGLTRENVASHLQKYRLYLKRVQGMSAGSAPHHDAATEQLFATGPLPHHLLAGARPPPPPPESFSPFAAALQHQQQQQMAALQHQYHLQQRGMTHLGPAFDHGYPVGRQQGPLQQRIPMGQAGPYGDEYESGRSGERKVLTLFPTND